MRAVRPLVATYICVLWGNFVIELAERMNVKHNFNQEITLAGKHRAQGFLIRSTEPNVRKHGPTKLEGSWLLTDRRSQVFMTTWCCF
jgi:hypothetical protein